MAPSFEKPTRRPAEAVERPGASEEGRSGEPESSEEVNERRKVQTDAESKEDSV